MITLWCYIRGSEPYSAFYVEIDASKTVAALKRAIKSYLKNTFKHVDAHKLKLWKVLLPCDQSIREKVEELMSSRGASYLGSSRKKLNTIFPDKLEENQIYIVVGAPPSAPRSSKRTRPSTHRRDNSLGGRLAQPSEIKNLSTFLAGQPEYLALPITLLHPIFNEFREDCKNHQPKKDDNALACDLSDAMSNPFDDERARQAEFVGILREHGICISPTGTVGTPYYTEGGLQYNGFPYFIVNPAIFHKPYHFNRHFTHPCVAVYLMGSILGFLGLAFTNQVHIQVLGPPVRLDFDFTDNELFAMAARYLGALREVTDKLELCYDTEAMNLEATHPGTSTDWRFPCYSRYTCLIDSVERDIQYLFRPYEDKLLFIGESDGINICVKFTTRYSKETHEFCASRGIAPRLRGFEVLPGGWFMVVMDALTDEFEHIKPTETPEMYGVLLKEIKGLHEAGYVHGDLRNVNVVVRKGAGAGFMLLDFDWAGRIGEIRYPGNLNPDIWRPDGACDGELIEAEHDISMIMEMFQIDEVV